MKAKAAVLPQDKRNNMYPNTLLVQNSFIIQFFQSCTTDPSLALVSLLLKFFS